jgi:hypothetical protein
MKHILMNTLLLTLFISMTFNGLSQINKDLKLKLSLGAYGLTPPSKAYVDEYQFKPSANYSIGLVKDFKLNNTGNWLLRSELLYNRTNIKVGLEKPSPIPDNLDRFKLDQLMLPIKLTYVKNDFNLFAGLITNFNFSSQIKEFGDEYFEQVGTYNYDSNDGATLFKNTFVDRTLAIQYVLGFELKGKKGNAYGIEFIDYFGYKNYYSKYFGSSYDISHISSSAINLYVSFKLDKE